MAEPQISRVWNLDSPSSPAEASTFDRRESASSVESSQYLPLPQGHWLLNLQGSCPRCHHQHNAVKVKVKVTGAREKSSRVRCENCHADWLALGGRASTQISLLSSPTLPPDPLEKEVRSTLVAMVRSAIAFANPNLTDITDPTMRITTPEYTERSPGGNQDSSIHDSSGNTERVSFHIPVVRFQQQKPVGSTSTKRPATDNGDDSRAQRSTFNMRQRIISVLRRSSVKRFKASLREHDTGTTNLMPVQDTPAEEPLPAATSLVPHNHEALDTPGPGSPSHNGSRSLDSTNSNTEAAAFIAGLERYPITERNESWMRARLGEFRALRASSLTLASSISTNGGTQLTLDEVLNLPHTRQHDQYSQQVLGLGSHLGYFDGFYTVDNPRRSISISERTSEAITAVDDSTGTFNPRISWSEFLQQERRGSGSPRPTSTNSVRQARAEPRRSFESARSLSNARGRLSNRLSRQANGRSSTIYVTEPSLSQLQLADAPNEALEHASNEELPSPSSSSPPVNER